MGLFSRKKPKIKVQTSKKDGYSGWLKCSHCKDLIHEQELKKNLNCCPKCDYHYRLPANERVEQLTDKNSFKELFNNLQTQDPLLFVDSVPYPDRIKRAKDSSSANEAVIVGSATIEGIEVCLAIMDFSFMAGSMGSVVGEKLTLLAEHALSTRLPLVIVCASGGARMQESALSLMQMAKTSAALSRLSEAKLPYISVLTNPTTGGVTASFAALGDVIIAEPKALICFAGPRVIEQTTGQKLGDDIQKSEFLLEHGMIDTITCRHNLKPQIGEFLDYLTHNKSTPLDEARQIGGHQEMPSKIKELMELNDDETKN